MNYPAAEIPALTDGILERVSERDVEAWLAAKANQLIAEGISVETFGPVLMSYRFLNGERHIAWGMYAGGGHAFQSDHDSLQSAVDCIRAQTVSPEAQASRKREQAAKLMAEAEELEKHGVEVANA